MTASSASASPARVWTARHPCPGAGTISAIDIGVACSGTTPSRSSPAAASTIASTSPSSSLRSRVSTLPRRSCNQHVGSPAQHLRLTPKARRADPRARGELAVPRHEHVERARAFGHRGDHEVLGLLGRQVLRRVHGEIDVAVEERADDLGTNSPFRPAGSVDGVGAAIAGRRHRDQLALHPARSQGGGDLVRLGEREPRAPRPDPERHSERKVETEQLDESIACALLARARRGQLLQRARSARAAASRRSRARAPPRSRARPG